MVTLGKIAQVVVPAVRKFAQENQGLRLEAERRGIHNELATLEREIENKRAKLEERQRELAAVTEALSRSYDKK
jgi:Skp family chaperone for outer membrane proteins